LGDCFVSDAPCGQVTPNLPSGPATEQVTVPLNPAVVAEMWAHEALEQVALLIWSPLVTTTDAAVAAGADVAVLGTDFAGVAAVTLACGAPAADEPAPAEGEQPAIAGSARSARAAPSAHRPCSEDLRAGFIPFLS
jgi:hypothetical protein